MFCIYCSNLIIIVQGCVLVADSSTKKEVSRKGNVDLHIHTTASDGEYAPREVVRIAHELGLKAIAITDHDSISGLDEALSAGKEYGLEVIPGVEISVDYKGEMHILGYYVDLHDYDLAQMLEYMRTSRERRNRKIVEKLSEIGIHIEYDELKAKHGETVGKPHIAQKIIEKGFAKDVHEAIQNYLIEGKPAYVPREKVSPKDAIFRISASGGVPVLAHPYFLCPNKEKVHDTIRILAKVGISGLEVFYQGYGPEEILPLSELCDELGLVKTGGTDFHGPKTTPGINMGSINVPYETVEKLKERAQFLPRF